MNHHTNFDYNKSSEILISVVAPVYKAQDCLIELHKRLTKSLSEITDNFEIIMVNDGSPDNSWSIIKQIASQDIKIKGINLSRNFGQHCAITAGLNSVRGDWVVVMDCDLQDRPEEIGKLYKKAKEGHDIVLARRVNRQDFFIKKFLSRLFYFILSYLTGVKHDGSVANFGIYNKKVINAIVDMKDQIRYFPTMIWWIGFDSVSIDTKHSNSSRGGGKTSYSLKKLLRLAFDITVSFSDKPLRLTVKLGLLISFSSCVVALYILAKYIKGEISITGWSSLILSIWFLSGVIIFVLGIVGLYVGKIFNQVKGRQVYIVEEFYEK